MTNQLQSAVEDGPSKADVRERRSRLLSFMTAYYLQVTTAVVIVGLSVFVPDFGNRANLQNIATQASFAGLVACGMTLLITAGLFDLSVAGIIAVVGVVTAKVLPGTTIGMALLLAIVVGIFLGLTNGVVVTKLRIPPFISTFGMLNIYLAVAFIATGGQVIPIDSYYFQQLGTATVAGAPLVFIAFSVVAAASYCLLYRTYFGRRLRAIGSSEQAARMAGIPVDRVKILAFGLTGLFTAIAAIGLSALLSSSGGTMAKDMELNAIAITVVGGTALRGGRGTLLGTFTAAIFITVIANALNLLDVSSYVQNIVTGFILIAALIVGSVRKDVVRGAG
ncbi:ABC transporter permease [Streptomyces hygroscopicus]|nr:ABC transporter permease [Streptomyces hygroscopicus]GLV77769.1 L-arabinose ABC transporter permease AraH [Streptomyces hygroscopicus subsp. hygroscopicus]